MNLIKNYLDLLSEDIHWGLTTNWYLRFNDQRFFDPNYGGIKEMEYWVNKLGFIPAESVTEQLASVSPGQLNLGHLIFSYPDQRGTSKYLNVTIYDTENLVFHRMLRAWMDYIAPPDGSAMRPLSFAARRIEVHKVDNLRRPIKSYAYRVFPANDLNYQGQSSSGLVQISVEFFVVTEYTL